jgi:PAS domain S-box-containing protein
LDLNQIALLTTAIASVALGMIVWQRTPDRVWNRLFAAYATGAALWTFLNFLIMTAGDAQSAALWLRLTHPVVALGICLGVDFAWTFPDRIDYVSATRRMMLYAIGLLFGAVALAPNLIKSITLQPGTISVVNVEYGPAFAPFGLFVIVALVYADLVMLRKALRLRGLQQAQVIYVLAGLVGTHISGILAIIVIPLVWGTTAYSGWGAGGQIITLAGMGYAIAKHRLMRPQAGIRRLASATIALVGVFVVFNVALLALRPYLAWSTFQSRDVWSVLGMAMGIAVVFLYRRVHAALERDSSARLGLATPSTHILRTLNAQDVLDLLARTLAQRLEATSVVVYLRDEALKKFVPHAWHAREDEQGVVLNPIPVTSRIVVTLDRAVPTAGEPEPLSLDSIRRFHAREEVNALVRGFEALRAEVIAPMVWEKRLIGLVVVGPKNTDDMYAAEDYAFASHMTLQACLALSNAKLYAETARLKDFNENILREMDNAVLVTSPEGRIIVFNNAAERLFGIPVEQAEGAPMDVLPVKIARCIRAVLNTGRVFASQHTEVQRENAEPIPVACSVSSLRGNGSDASAVIAVVSDLTLLRELERERAEAERLSIIRRISTGMAHEIRNPLVAIRTFTELAPDRMDDPEFRSTFLAVAQQEIDRIDKLVGDLMSLSKPAGAVIEPVPIDVICKQVLRSVSGIAESKQVSVGFTSDELSVLPMGDSGRMHQAILNLVTNAIDEEPAGGSIRVSVREGEDESGTREIVISVHNANSYIPPEKIEEIFRPFYSDKEHGTGLGLAICQTIVEEHDSEIIVNSEPDSGTEFVIRMPIKHSTPVASLAGELIS